MKIESVSPILSVDDLVKSIAFYRHPLGFDLAWSWGEPADIAAVCRDSVEITLTQRAGAKPVGTAHIYLGVSGIDDYYQTLVGAGDRGIHRIAPFLQHSFHHFGTVGIGHGIGRCIGMG